MMSVNHNVTIPFCDFWQCYLDNIKQQNLDCEATFCVYIKSCILKQTSHGYILTQQFIFKWLELMRNRSIEWQQLYLAYM